MALKAILPFPTRKVPSLGLPSSPAGARSHRVFMAYTLRPNSRSVLPPSHLPFLLRSVMGSALACLSSGRRSWLLRWMVLLVEIVLIWVLLVLGVDFFSNFILFFWLIACQGRKFLLESFPLNIVLAWFSWPAGLIDCFCDECILFPLHLLVYLYK